MQALYSAASGVKSQQKRIDVLANNVANINTYGFKSSRVNFKDALYQTMLRPVQPQADLNLELGHGVLLSDITMDFHQGALLSTGNSLDCYIEGDGFFTLQDSQGILSYTRSGAFAKSVEADGTYLVANKGAYVLDAQGQRVRLPEDGSFSVGPDGTLTDTAGIPYAQLGIANFSNQAGLQAMGNGVYQPTEASGELLVVADPQIKQGYLEGSNVDLAGEMTRLIRAQRALSMASRAITTADEMDSTANNLRA
jgi:flagellar basal-body rod protein FlgG